MINPEIPGRRKNQKTIKGVFFIDNVMLHKKGHGYKN